jgi:hypothetical protein
VRTVAGTEGGIQFPCPSEVYPLGHFGENAGGLTQTPLVSRTKPPVHVIGSADPGTGESDWQIPLSFKNFPDGQAEVLPSVYALLTQPPSPSEIRPDAQVFFP